MSESWQMMEISSLNLLEPGLAFALRWQTHMQRRSKCTKGLGLGCGMCGSKDVV